MDKIKIKSKEMNDEQLQLINDMITIPDLYQATDWERQFLRDLMKWKKISPKQVEIVRKIRKKFHAPV